MAISLAERKRGTRNAVRGARCAADRTAGQTAEEAVLCVPPATTTSWPKASPRA